MTVERLDPELEHLNGQDDRSLPPHSTHAEEALLGSILKHGPSIAKVVTEILPSDFFHPRNQHVYAAMCAIWRRNEQIDHHTLFEELQRQGTAEAAGGYAYLGEINLAMPRSEHIAHYCKIVRDYSTRRRLIAAAGSVAEIGWTENNADEAMQRSLALVNAVAGREMGRKLIYPEEWVGRYQDRLENINAEGALGLSFGWTDVDKYTLGLMPGLVLVAGRPGMGKSEFIEQVVLNVSTGTVAKGGVGTHAGKNWSLFISIEMTEEELAERATSQWAMVNKDRLIRGHMGDNEYARIAQALSDLSECRLALAVESGITTDDVRALALQLIAEKGPLDVIAVDYVQLLKDKAGSHSSRSDDLGVVANNLKRLAMELNCTVLAAAQLNRGVEERHPPIPILSDLRDSGELEQAADMVLMLYRDEVYHPDTEKKFITDVIVRKHRRYGKLVGMNAQLLYQTRFLDLDVYRA